MRVPQAKEERPTFLKKRSKKLLSDWFRASRSRPRKVAGAPEQKFFGSFFQKRTLSSF
jgi:hypothetical protein